MKDIFSEFLREFLEIRIYWPKRASQSLSESNCSITTEFDKFANTFVSTFKMHCQNSLRSSLTKNTKLL